MEDHLDERYTCVQEAIRKGRSKSACTLKTGFMLDESGLVVLRGLDKSGTASLVALLTPDHATNVTHSSRNRATLVRPQTFPLASWRRASRGRPHWRHQVGSSLTREPADTVPEKKSVEQLLYNLGCGLCRRLRGSKGPEHRPGAHAASLVRR